MRGVNRVSQLSNVLVWLCAGSGRQVGWKPQWLRSYRVFCRECKHANRPEIPRFLPIATNQKLRCIFDSVQTASRRAGNTARRGVCTLSDVMLVGSIMKPRNQGRGCAT